MTPYNTLIWNTNSREVEHYDIMPYLIDCYNEEKHKPQTFDQFKDFVKRNCMYQYWARCEYEFLIISWPPYPDPLKYSTKIDVWQQIAMNIDIVTKLLMDNINGI